MPGETHIPCPDCIQPAGHLNRRVLSDADLEALAEVFAAHNCRYPIAPDRLTKVVDFCEWFIEGREETAKKFRSVIVYAVVWGFVIAVVGWMFAKLGLFHGMLHEGGGAGPPPP